MFEAGRLGGTVMSEYRPPVRSRCRGDVRVTWTRRWETTLDDAEHKELMGLLTRAFPWTPAFSEGRSWAGSRPELRLLGHLDGTLVAHAATTRRFLRAPDDDRDVLVGDVGLVAVDPDRRGLRLGGALMEEVGSSLAGLGLPFGFLTCGRHVEAFYRQCGWSKTYQPVQAIDIHHHVEMEAVNGMVFPVLQPLEVWPRGRLVRDGQEI